jgi:glycosyltransferase involved in cell wall biosynthesis
MNVAFAIHESLLSQGGVEVLTREMIKHFSTKHRVFLISKDTHETIKNLPEGCMLEGTFAYPSNEAISEDWIQTLISWLKHNKVDLCHFHSGGTYGFHARSWFRCPITRVSKAGIRCFVTNHQALPCFDPVRNAQPIWRQLLAVIAKWPGKSKQLYLIENEVTVSNHDLAISRSMFPFSKKKFLRIYHSRVNTLEQLAPLPHSRKILNVATLAKIKGQNVLIEAFNLVCADFPEWSLTLVGYDSEDGSSAKLKARIRALGLEKKVVISGPHTNPVEFYRSAEVYVQPSLAEALGLSLQEAMFYGLPCIGSRIGGIPELISDGKTGYLVDSGNIGSLAQALGRLLSNRTEREFLGLAAHNSILERGISSHSMLKQYESLYVA